ncbi:hypothetical protein R3P38DRAFT_3188421 [Favolaschia claudopus]|uniref:Uncharacterized protein n=1 Tax=Favolaschia claudopus TaxID=2862362 RepID=A0AAW0BWV1_9AGAR
MRPHFSYGHGFHSWRGPRRAVWFLVGAAAATMWHHHREAHHHVHERYFGHCYRPPVQYRPNDPALPNPPECHWRPRDVPSAINHMPPAPLQAPSPAPLPWGYPESHKDYQWEEEKRKMQAIGRQAEDVMTKLSEDALDTVMGSMEALKAKLAEYRAQREAAQRQLEKELEEERNRPHRFV